MKKISLLSSDLDGTLVGIPETTLAFAKTWKRIPDSGRPLLCYNSGRSVDETLQLLKRVSLPEPDFLICGVGTLIYDYAKKKVIEDFFRNLKHGWDRSRIDRILAGNPGIEKQPEKFQNRFKSSWYYHNASDQDIEKLSRMFQSEGLDVNVIYSSSCDLDILPVSADKGNALGWLIKHLKIPPDEVLVAGDTGNDISMFQLKGVSGIIVQNAQPELLSAVLDLPDVFISNTPYAEGVLRGLIHYGLIKRIGKVRQKDIPKKNFAPEINRIFDSEEVAGLSAEQKKTIETGFEKALEVIYKNITDMGYSACSISDNSFISNDSNYQSVWGRDGAITIMGTLSLSDPRLRKCEKDTLSTLLRNISPNGQIPSNVSISDGTPDYSGVGGICSIDSALWLIIAFYQFVQKTKDIAFLREWFTELQSAMNWLSAHDSNNDGLLEIPEAGDWTDLFGRNYNVLYDEVLWFWANVCFGRLAGLQGDLEAARGYLAWAQNIKKTIIQKFWPTTKSDFFNASFADMQYSVGDTKYLLAQVTPFSFDWRCDVYGNLLAALMNVLDIEKSKAVFRFMWGVGANQPFPVRNLYPVVNAGDPDWRPYYTVNLLNLPNHYHNGGIWPFIGAQWVRFIHRLGYSDIAGQELYRLALANREGISGEWEFNEWLHGETGKAMGKACQAWSAAGYIRACHDLSLLPDDFE